MKTLNASQLNYRDTYRAVFDDENGDIILPDTIAHLVLVGWQGDDILLRMDCSDLPTLDGQMKTFSKRQQEYVKFVVVNG